MREEAGHERRERVANVERACRRAVALGDSEERRRARADGKGMLVVPHSQKTTSTGMPIAASSAHCTCVQMRTQDARRGNTNMTAYGKCVHDEPVLNPPMQTASLAGLKREGRVSNPP